MTVGFNSIIRIMSDDEGKRIHINEYLGYGIKGMLAVNAKAPQK